MWRSRIVTIAVICVASLGASPAKTSKSDAARAEVQAFVKAYVEAENKGDASAIMEMISKNADVASVTMGEITRGWDGIRDDVDAMTGAPEKVQVTLGTIEVIPLGTNFALTFAPCTITSSAAAEGLQLRGALTLVLEKSGKAWKILHEHTSAQPPPDEGD